MISDVRMPASHNQSRRSRRLEIRYRVDDEAWEAMRQACEQAGDIDAEAAADEIERLLTCDLRLRYRDAELPATGGAAMPLLAVALGLAAAIGSESARGAPGAQQAIAGDGWTLLITKGIWATVLSAALPGSPSLVVPTAAFREDVERFLAELTMEALRQAPALFQFERFAPLHAFYRPVPDFPGTI